MFRDPRGCIIHDRGRALVGAVREVYCDPETQKAQFVEVALSRKLGSDEDSILYPWEGLIWTPGGSLFMNDWIQEAIGCQVHSYEKVMHLKGYALETLDQALQRNPSFDL